MTELNNTVNIMLVSASEEPTSSSGEHDEGNPPATVEELLDEIRHEGFVDPSPSMLRDQVVQNALITLALSGGGLWVSPGAAVGVYELVKEWVDARDGRKLRLKVADVEVEATQMADKDVLELLGLLEDNSDRNKVRALLIEANNGRRTPER